MRNAIVTRVEGWIDRHFIGFTVTGLLGLFLAVYFAGNIFITIPPGHGGVLRTRFFGGTDEGLQNGEGTKIIFPWDKIYVYDLRIQQEDAKFDVLTSEGLEISTDVTILFRLVPNGLAAINSYAGPDFVKTIVMPSVGAMVRVEAAKHTAEAIYSTDRHVIERDILTSMRNAVEHLIPDELHPGSEILLLDLWFKSITLPPSLQSAIENKLAQREVAEQYTYILQREKQEKERKRIEAEGIKIFQQTVSSGITDSYLRWKGIDATLKLAESPNAKVVVVGSGKDGLPLILGPWENSTGTPPKPGQAAAVPPEKGAATVATPAPSLPTRLPTLSEKTLPKVQGLPAEPLAISPQKQMPIVDGPVIQTKTNN
jgi:regulator of protease activity HflC (stomatin/prohibitin superfamily)